VVVNKPDYPTRVIFEMLEPCEVKVSCTVLRGERG